MKGRHWKPKRGEEKRQVHEPVLGVGAAGGQQGQWETGRGQGEQWGPARAAGDPGGQREMLATLLPYLHVSPTFK